MSAILRILALSFAHFVIGFVFGVLTFGTDMDQLRSRSALSRASGVVYDLLWLPHDAILRALPPGAILRPGVIPGVLIGSSLLWGVGLYALWRGGMALRKRGAGDL